MGLGTEQATTRTIVAYHEAGHATVARCLGVKVVRATIKPCGVSAGHVAYGKIFRRGDLEYDDSPAVKRRAERSLLISLGGPFAQKRYAPRSRWRSHNYTGIGGDADFDYIHEIIYRLHGEGKVAMLFRRYMEAWAEQVVERYWNEIELVALALIERETMTGEEINAAIWVAKGWPNESN